MSDVAADGRSVTVLAVDLFGFPRQTEDDRQKIAQAFAALTARLESAAARHGGRIAAKGDEGFLMAFNGADAGMQAAEEIATGPWPPVRVGVHWATALTAEAAAIGWRIMQAADKGTVIVSDAVRKMIGAANITRRLNREPAPLTTDKPGEVVGLYRLSYVQPVDVAAQRQTNRRLYMIAGTVVVVAAIAVWAVFGRDIVTTLAPRHDHVAVMRLASHGGSKAAGDFADGLTDEINYVLKEGGIPTVAVADAEKLRGSDRDGTLRRQQVGAVLDGSVAGSGANLDIKLAIDDPVNHKTLWSHDFVGGGEDLKTQVSSRVIGVLTCSARALRPGVKVGGPEVLTLYLKFCDLDSDAASSAQALVEEERILRQLTRQAPDFTYGHSNLALFLISKSEIDPANAAGLRTEAASEAETALKLDPKNGDGYIARARLTAPPGWTEREHDLTLALSLPTPGPNPNVVYAQMLPEVGRLREAARLARKGARLSPWDADILAFSAQTAAEAGRTDDADLALTTALQMAPANPVVAGFRFHIYEWLGRWDDALRLLDDAANRPPQLAQEDDLAATRLFILGMKSTDTSAKVAARDAAIASARRDRSHLMAALSHLSALGFEDEAFRLAAEIPPSAQTDDVSVFFTPLIDPMRRDPRFMDLAGKIGLTDYWTKSGRWPDFCGDAGLPYSCKAEVQAAKAS